VLSIGVEHTLFNISDRQGVAVDSQLEIATANIDTVTRSPIALANDMALASKVSEWAYYSTGQPKHLISASEYLLASQKLRPTWPYTYVEMLRLGQYAEQPWSMEQTYELGLRFGPQFYPLRLLVLQQKFIDWKLLSPDAQIHAANSLIVGLTNPRSRWRFQKFIATSPARLAMCSLLRFNAIILKECKS
jgi:hypothetical protein